jgi:hypothetical protein
LSQATALANVEQREVTVDLIGAVFRHNLSRDQRRAVFGESRPEYDYRLDTARRLWRARTRVRLERTCVYMRTSGKSIRTRPLDCNDDAARRVAPEKGPDSELRNEPCRQVSCASTEFKTPFEMNNIQSGRVTLHGGDSAVAEFWAK